MSRRSLFVRSSQCLQYLAVRSCLAAVRLLPEFVHNRLGSAVGFILCCVLPVRRATVRKNLELALPEKSEVERRKIAKAFWKSFGRGLFENARLYTMSDDAIRSRVRYSDDAAPIYHEAIARGTGIILVTGHIGNYELVSIAPGLIGHPMLVVARELSNVPLHAYVKAFRSRGGNDVISRGSVRGIRTLFSRLKKGGVVGLIIDQHASPIQGVLVPFFGTLAWSYSGPAEIALRTGALVLPGFIRKDPDRPGHHLIHLHPPIDFEGTGNLKEDVENLTARMQSAVEEEIRSSPEDWLWFHRRWKQSPDAPDIYPERERRRRPRGVVEAS